ncbi:hypothetical protein OFL38_32400, partial [Pseudomonas aeruginosa]|nr:hypothetical protein [Pseudomonas aeruginosa]
VSVNPIIQAQFVDLYLGEGFADVKGLAGAGARRVEVPREWEPHAQELLQHCRQTLEELQDPEFAIVVDGVLLRVTLLEDAFSGSVFVLRRSTAQLREFQEIGYPSEVVSALMDPQLQGLVLFCGEMATGKTSSAASLLLARLQELGGWAAPSRTRRKPTSAVNMGSAAASRSEPHGAQADTARLCCARCGPAPTWC